MVCTMVVMVNLINIVMVVSVDDGFVRYVLRDDWIVFIELGIANI